MWGGDASESERGSSEYPAIAIFCACVNGNLKNGGGHTGKAEAAGLATRCSRRGGSEKKSAACATSNP